MKIWMASATIYLSCELGLRFSKGPTLKCEKLVNVVALDLNNDNSSQLVYISPMDQFKWLLAYGRLPTPDFNYD